ncbi:hypothetical protein E1B28_010850 [Marasmius oreades]|uniref:SHSP domain-containing protein n=1 Tax=Marasmius oreades TaxID=181124 RepID=A0A9P7RT26_9AGAR|nr:uncharacterized protein E1B28_010850 [Marasmius oreades]KAG7089142.1 hypothetical protein E1B28_010850 [Marasmius oreades]
MKMSTPELHHHHQQMSLPLPTRIPADGQTRVINLARGASEGLLFDSLPSSPSCQQDLAQPLLTPVLPATSPTTPTSSSPTMFRSPVLEVPRVSPPPSISTSHSASSTAFSPMERSRRTAPPSNSPAMKIYSSPTTHRLQVKLPLSIQPEMVTISANKGAKLKVVADAWHLESDCHYEWLISFPPHDIDMSRIQAKFETDGHLTIDVRRRRRHTV